MTVPDAVRMLGISCRFGSVQALHGADFHLAAGEVHALLGENGAGKTTLMRVLYGLVQPDDGCIELDGQAWRPRSPRDAIAHGIALVPQHDTLVERMSVAENVWLGRGGFRTDLDEARRVLSRLGEQTGLMLDHDAPAGSLSAGQRQRLEILKALARDPRVLVLDEPASSLAPPDADALLAAIRRMRGRVSIVLITHKLRDIAAIADRVTVLRQGSVVLTTNASASTAELAAAMIGDTVGTDAPPLPGDAAPGAAVLTHGPVTVRSGEIVGIAAVEGNGQRELLRAIAAAQPAGAFIPEDRHREALLMDFSLEENLALGRPHGFWISRRVLRDAAERAIESFRVSAPGPAAPVRALSGGNQQKLVLARALAARAPVLVAENPTRGLDVHATAEIHERLRSAARAGAGVLFYSTDLDEVLALSDRVVVMAGGRWIEVAACDRSRERVGALMVGAA